MEEWAFNNCSKEKGLLQDLVIEDIKLKKKKV